jgi:hypothetical protein
VGMLEWLLTGHTGLQPMDYLINALFAFLGAATCTFAINPRLKAPRRAKDGFEPGFLSILLVGVASGLAIGHRIPVPFLVGLVAPMLLPPLLNGVVKLVPALLGATQPALVQMFEALIKGLKGDKQQ